MSNPEHPVNDGPGAAAGDAADSVLVDICGRRYNIRGGYDSETIRVLAEYVDQRMRQVAAQVGPGDALRVAVLTALNIADDYYRTRTALEQREQQVTDMARELAEKLAAALEPVNRGVRDRVRR